MSSPFPGMDPFLEHLAHWYDFRLAFVNYWSEAIADVLPPQYEASLCERVYPFDHDPDVRELGRPDVVVTPRERPTAASSSPLAILEGPRETSIQILHQSDRSLVAALELLSPAKKEEPGRSQYLAKREALLYQKVHLVELDLLLGGRRLMLQRPLPPADYYYFLSRGDQRPDCQVYHWGLRQPLPTLPVPLRAPDPDLRIDLGAVFTTAYDRGRFRRRIRYQEPLPVRLRDEDARWAASVLAGK